MRVEIHDPNSLSRLSLIDVRSYLTTRGWRNSGRYGSVANIFVNVGANNQKYEILLPVRPELKDYAARMSDIVTVLAEYEVRSQLEVYHDLIMGGFDVVRFRAPEADDAGTIRFENGVALYDSAKDVIAAATNAAIKPKRAYRGNSSERAKNYLGSLRLGQTEIGSYVLTVLSPVQPALEDDQLQMFSDIPSDTDPFERVVTRTLDRALSATKSAIEEATASGKLDPFESAVDSGVSANLCDAIAKLVDEGNGVSISVSWSHVRPAPSAAASYSFTRDNARVLIEAAGAFRAREPQSDTTIEGFVIGLHREHMEFDGKAKIRGFVDGRVRTLSAQFILPDYRKVTDAHDRKLRVRVDGDLIRRGQVQYLENARNLVVFSDDSEDDGTTWEMKR
jgi:hypothetical protein